MSSKGWGVVAGLTGWGQARQKSLERAMQRQDAIAATQRLLQQACDDIARTHEDPEIRKYASQWAYRMADCAGTMWAYRCPTDGHSKTACSCCHVALCPRRERRYAQAWVERIRHLAETTVPPDGYTWKLITISPRKRGSLAERIDRVIELRAALARKLRDEYGLLGGFGAIEMGEDESVHCHFLALCKYAPQPALKSWMQRRDCTVRGCKHPPDDRCTECKRAHTDCHHPEAMPDGRQRERCNGSWVVDVRKCRRSKRRAGRLYDDNGADGAVETVKYMVKPPTVADPENPSTNELAYARRVAEFYLLMRGRHRVEPYGIARPHAPNEESNADDVEPTHEHEAEDADKAPRCPKCGEPMVCVGVGRRTFEGSRYVWDGRSHRPHGPSG